MILLVVGVVVLASVLLGVYHSPNWLWLTSLMGVHLIQASFTGMCPGRDDAQAHGLAVEARLRVMTAQTEKKGKSFVLRYKTSPRSIAISRFRAPQACTIWPTSS